MTKIKICGLTRVEDVKWANELLPDYVGFVFAKSKRQLCPEQAKKIAIRLNTRIKTVGVFVDYLPEQINKVAKVCNLDVAQLHGEETPDECNKVNIPVWKAFRMQNQKVIDRIYDYKVDAILLDGYHSKSNGGEGITFPWEWAKDIDFKGIPLAVAGGLGEHNVEKAISILNPEIVDVSSWVETDGIKDTEKIKQFIRKVRGL